ncbi:uncharacterized protein I303_100433 [Kwoniella dejecticola CBS 10117]|uniref:Glucan synthesis regulatory protein n=1 Tax=Kwoniella dejecticola CBS 10117 TaxID=1296121 RepID=A0A1A6AEW6_9TREE|nr:glucan synthesis regulatory protein [Kwoniella dejecticola CBS 10117]OBR88615.1 glucan synthesis regulatory protein [Kwoniella dejecticola CBS 10117]
MPFLRSISNFFAGSSGANASSSRTNNRRSVMDSTVDAFSLPTAQGKYGDGGLPTDSAASSPGPSRRGSLYPPPKDAFAGSPNYFPPPTHTFHRLRNALANSFPELLETLNGPANPHLLAAFEAELGCSLPRAVRESLLAVDGQDLEACANISGSGGLFLGLHFLPLEEIMREWAFWRQAENDPMAGNNAAVLATMASVPPNWIKKLYACRGWIPLLSDRTGNYVGVDLDPGHSGSWGQVIVFGRDFDRKCVLWRGDGEGGWGKWLASFVEDLESGEGWEVEKNGGSNGSTSDEEEDIGYGSYNGGGSFGESGRGLRLAGEYRGWNVLEAWWDKSVRKWDTLGLGLDVADVEKGLEEAKALAGYTDPSPAGKGKGKAVEGLGIGMRTGESAAQVEIPVVGSPRIPTGPGTPVPHDLDVLLPPASPEQPPIPKIRHPAPSPVRVITPVAATADHPLKATTDSSGYLSPPSRSPPRSRRREPPPIASPIDLPTRADVQAMAAIAQAEKSGLRGGWVMNLDVSAGNAARRASRMSPNLSGGPETDMVDIDLEGGRAERFGSPRMTDAEMERQREEEKLALAGVEHRRSPQLIQPSRTPSPLSRESSFDEPSPSPIGSGSASEKTPRALSRGDSEGLISIPPSVIAATQSIRPPPRAANNSELNIRTFTREDEQRDAPLYRGNTVRPGRKERESSVVSMTSQDELLDRASLTRSPSPSFTSTNPTGEIVHSPTAISMSRTTSASENDYEGRLASPLVSDSGRRGNGFRKEDKVSALEDELEEISIA